MTRETTVLEDIEYLKENIEMNFRMADARNTETLLKLLEGKTDVDKAEKFWIVRNFIEAYRNYILGRNPVAS